MARLFGTAIDLNKSELIKARVQNLASAPSAPVSGQIYYDTVLNQLGIYNGSSWDYVLGVEAQQDLVGAMTSGTENGITVAYDDATGTLTYTVLALNSLPIPTGSLNLNNNKISNLADGTSSSDAATYGQLVAILNGQDWKASVRVATTAAGTLATSFENGDTVDGVVLATGDRILLKDQAAGATNGIYVVAASGAPTRATDADSSAEVTGGMTVFVSEGTVNGNTTWTLTTDDVITLGTTALVFAQTSRSVYAAGAGITLTGLTFSATVDGTTIDAGGAGSSLRVIPGVYTSKYSATIGDNASTSFNVDHNLNTRDVAVEVYDLSTYAEITASVVHSTVNRVVLEFDAAPTTNQYRVVVIG